MDTRRFALDAMVDAFLGEAYDPDRRSQLEELQLTLHREQAELHQRLLQGAINNDEYVTQANDLIEKTFQACEKLLGPEDFLQLFGAPPQAAAGLIDRDIFLSKATTPQERLPVELGSPVQSSVYANCFRVLATPEDLILDFGLKGIQTGTPADPAMGLARLIMNYYTAKRLVGSLELLLQQIEHTFGALKEPTQLPEQGRRRPSGAAC